MKFKIGDKVRILDGSKIENYECGWDDVMAKYIGRTATIERPGNFLSANAEGYRLKEIPYTWDERGLELVEEAEQPNDDEPKADEPKVEVKSKESKEHFMKVAAEVTHEFDDLLHKAPELVLLLAMYSSKLAHKLFDD